MVSPNPWMILPFGLLLVAMAAAPVVASRWWSKHYSKVALAAAAITLAYYFIGLHAGQRILHTAHEYLSFIVLIGSLFVVSGGIHIVVKGKSCPSANVLFLLAGALAANLLGTTGAAMLLIRPWIRVNAHRIAGYHIAFFIFLVANVGGCLTPIGDPPLFLGFLHGLPFWWVAAHCWPMWAVATGLLLAIFYLIDKYHFNRAPEKSVEHEVWRFDGYWNLVFLAAILAAVFIERPFFLRETIMIAAATGSYWMTQRRFRDVHEKNEFEFHPVKEVAVLFAGIFATMMPALDWLDGHASQVLGAEPQPAVFYWATGGLSAVLDNAPTYLGFLSALAGVSGTGDVPGLLAHHGSDIAAISTGAVFFGAATYIGNGPNFMIKAVAERQGIATPTFLGYLWRYSLPILLPVLAVVWLIFFR